MGMAFTKQRKNPLPAEKETFCFVLPAKRCLKYFQSCTKAINAKYPLRKNLMINNEKSHEKSCEISCILMCESLVNFNII